MSYTLLHAYYNFVSMWAVLCVFAILFIAQYLCILCRGHSKNWNVFIFFSQTLKVLQQHLQFCTSETLGHLTSCPTNIGTGMRASLHMRLFYSPKLKHFKQMISMLNLQVRGQWRTVIPHSYTPVYAYAVYKKTTFFFNL